MRILTRVKSRRKATSLVAAGKRAAKIKKAVNSKSEKPIKIGNQYY